MFCYQNGQMDVAISYHEVMTPIPDEENTFCNQKIDALDRPWSNQT